jgi:cytochrome P450
MTLDMNIIASSPRPTFNVDLEALKRDPLPFFEQIRQSGPIAWIAPLKMWYVVGYDEVHAILIDNVYFSTGTRHSLLFDTFGTHMLTQSGAEHLTARKPIRNLFSGNAIRAAMTESLAEIANSLIDGFADDSEVELKSAFASRLPILAMLKLFGLDAVHEAKFRAWYNRFEKALANFTWDNAVCEAAKEADVQFHALLAFQISAVRKTPGEVAREIRTGGISGWPA